MNKKYKSYIFLLLIIFTTSMFAQTDAFTNEVEHRDGKVYFQNKLFSGTLYSEEDGIPNDCDCTLKAHYKKGLLHGTKRLWYRSGKLKEVSKYKNGILLEKTLYYSNGKPKKKEKYKNGKLIASTLYNKDGTPKKTLNAQQKTNAKTGLQNQSTQQVVVQSSVPGRAIEGLDYTYFPNGHKKEVKLIKNGLLIKDSLFDINGQLKWAKRYQDGELIHEEIYNPPGKLSQENNFLYNKKHGVQKEYYASGTPKVIEKYENGDLISKEIFNEKEQLVEVQNYKLNKKHGLQKKFNQQGQLTNLEEYNMGKLLRKERYAGNEKELVVVTGNIAQIKTYNDKGKLIKLYYETVPGKQKDSVYLEFDPVSGHKLKESAYKKGKLIRQGQYKNNQKEGLWQYYWQDGKKMTSKVYKNNKVVSEKTLTYAKQLKNNFKNGDLIYAKIVSTPRKYIQLILVRIDTSQTKTPYKLIKNRIVKVFKEQFKPVNNLKPFNQEELYAIVDFKNFEYRFKSKNNKKFMAYIKFDLVENNLKNEIKNQKMFMIAPEDLKYIKDKKQAFFKTLNHLEKKLAIDLQNRFPYTGAIARVLEQSKNEITKVNVYFDDMGPIKEKDELTVTGDKGKAFAQIKVSNITNRIVTGKVISGGKRLKYYMEHVNKHPLVKYLPKKNQ